MIVARARVMGFRCGSNILISRACLPQIQAFLDALQTIGLDELGFEIAIYNAHRRGRYYHEKYRPTLDEVLPYAADIHQLSDLERGVEQFTRTYRSCLVSQGYGR